MDFIIHCLGSAVAPHALAALYQTGGGIPAYSPTAKREENSAEAPPSAPANDDALLGLEQNCVREIYTHNTPEGSGAATALQNTVTPSLSI